jgi:hypothetical protein
MEHEFVLLLMSSLTDVEDRNQTFQQLQHNSKVWTRWSIERLLLSTFISTMIALWKVAKDEAKNSLRHTLRVAQSKQKIVEWAANYFLIFFSSYKTIRADDKLKLWRIFFNVLQQLERTKVASTSQEALKKSFVRFKETLIVCIVSNTRDQNLSMALESNKANGWSQT